MLDIYQILQYLPYLKGKITPGPGHYYSKKGLIPEGPKYTMRKRLKRSKSNGIPGPGKYKINANNHPEEPKYSFGKEKKCNYILKQAIKDGFPGPGKYNVNVKNFTKGYAFSKNKKIRKVENITPGPCYYKIPTAFDYISEHTRQHGIFDKTFQYLKSREILAPTNHIYYTTFFVKIKV